MVIWIIGLSGAGKTTVGRALWRSWRETERATVLIDGDEVREMFGHNAEADAHSVEGRRRNAERIVSMCRWLDRQRINVVCCILSIFPDMRAANREMFSEYVEVYLEADLATLVARDGKDLYRPALDGVIDNVVGVDIPFTPPDAPDLTFETGTGALSGEQIADKILGYIRGEASP